MDAKGRTGEKAAVGRRALLGLFLATLALRPVVVGVGPLASPIASEFGTTFAFVGLLTTISVMCMAVFAPLGPWLAGRIDARRAMVGALGLIVGFGVLRAAAPNTGLVLASTIGIGVGVGAAGALPAVVAGQWSSVGKGTTAGTATAGIVAGAIVGAALAAPLADILGGWRSAALVLALAGVASVVGWFRLTGGLAVVNERARSPIPAWRRRDAWLLGLVFGLQAIIYWGSSAWLPEVFVERGWSVSSAGVVLAGLNVSALLANLAVAAFSDRLGPRNPQILASAFVALGCLVGLFVQPTLGVVWIVGLGLALGAIFPLLFASSVDHSDDRTSAGSLGAFMLFLGYAMAAVGPLILGVARDVTGSFASTSPILVGVSLVLVAAAIALSRQPEPPDG